MRTFALNAKLTKDATVKSTTYTAAHTIFELTLGPVTFVLGFFSPVSLSNFVRQSLSFSYLTLKLSASFQLPFGSTRTSMILELARVTQQRQLIRLMELIDCISCLSGILGLARRSGYGSLRRRSLCIAAFRHPQCFETVISTWEPVHSPKCFRQDWCGELKSNSLENFWVKWRCRCFSPQLQHCYRHPVSRVCYRILQLENDQSSWESSNWIL